MAPQPLEKIESAPGNGMVSEVSDLQDMVHGRARRTVRRPRLTSARMTKVVSLELPLFVRPIWMGRR